ncbi:MAG: glycosyltransferase [Bacteroides sp.]|nr:glycosyltransferase [Bacteroides sp.]
MKSQNPRRVLLWTTAYADLLTAGPVGGIGVQMMFWAQAFQKSGWNVFSFYAQTKPKECDICTFIKNNEPHSVFFPLHFFVTLWILLKIKPEVVLLRGGKNRNLAFVAFWCKILGIKAVQFFASDVDFVKDYRTLTFAEMINRRMFNWGLKWIKYFVVQNDSQQAQLQKLITTANPIIIPNIWGEVGEANHDEEKVILWVGNTRSLKRPQWVFEIAKDFPEENFVLIGGNADPKVYDECVSLAADSDNVRFLGGLPFSETNEWFSKAKVLLCTSEYEGFPNTFLQAWSNGVPVLSTVNPGNRITDKNLGFVCKDINEFKEMLRAILEKERYSKCQDAINRYFAEAHSLDFNYKKLTSFLGV